MEDNLLQLHEDLTSGRYKHGEYESFYISDPKRRHIHKASVRDRVVHQAVFRILYHLFDKHFIYDSYSCRFNKGTHRGVKRLRDFTRRVTANRRRTAYVLKCDVVKFFANVDHTILLGLIRKKISDEVVLALIEKIIESFHASAGTITHVCDCASGGLPLGNVTSQLFANIYLNELDRFVKHHLSLEAGLANGSKAQYYIRYCDDFVMLHSDAEILVQWERIVRKFLESQLKLSLHKEISIRKISQGIDFLGYVVLPNHIVVRTSTKKRTLCSVSEKNLFSYLGIVGHTRAHRLTVKILRKGILSGHQGITSGGR